MTPNAPTPSDAPWLVQLNAKGGGQPLPTPLAGSGPPAGSLIWLNILEGDAARPLLDQIGDIPPKVAEYLIQPAEQERLVAVGDGLLMTLRGIEAPTPTAEVGMPVIRIWIGDHRLVTSASAPPSALRELYTDLIGGFGPTGPADFLGRLALLLIRDLGPLLDDHSGNLDLLEARVLTREVDHLGQELNQIRLELLRLHRHLSPGRTLLHELLQEHGRHRLGTGDALTAIREASERIDDRLERLEGIREHCGALQEAITDLQSQQMNNALYLLSLYTALFLPMGVLTGLLGINLAGIPGEQSPWGFWVVCVLLVVLGVAGYLVFKKIGLTQPVSPQGKVKRRDPSAS